MPVTANTAKRKLHKLLHLARPVMIQSESMIQLITLQSFIELCVCIGARFLYEGKLIF